ncbi:3-oxoacyl-ACP reductase FabG [Buchnera aphidicola]|uniref:3-oxoacyl-ACP reductase FabG n=1 Tax=Buchnera aphidicola TaxID=9 RepID=UPI0031B88081
MKKNILITGANKGIGEYIAKILSNEKNNIIGTSRSSKGINKINKYLKNKGKGIILNIEKKKDIKKKIKIIYKKFKTIDILINNAGIIKDSCFLKMKKKNWKKVLNVNLNSNFYLLKKILPNMIKNKYGRIIFIGSIIGSIGNIGQTNYATSKSGLIGLNKSIALEVAKYGITSNIISPGYIQTNINKHLNKKQKKKILSKIPMKRFGKKKEIAYAVKFLISNKASYITGQNLHINGGMYMI